MALVVVAISFLVPRKEPFQGDGSSRLGGDEILSTIVEMKKGDNMATQHESINMSSATTTQYPVNLHKLLPTHGLFQTNYASSDCSGDPYSIAYTPVNYCTYVNATQHFVVTCKAGESSYMTYLSV